MKCARTSGCSRRPQNIRSAAAGEDDRSGDLEDRKIRTSRTTRRSDGGATALGIGGHRHGSGPQRPRSGDRRRTEHEYRGAPGAVAGSADVADHRGGGWATRRWPQKNPESTPNKALYPTSAGRRMSAGG